MSLPSRLRFPMQICGELRLTPDGGFATVDGNRGHVFAEGKCGEHARDCVEVLCDRAVLNDCVRLVNLVEVTCAVQEDRAGIDARIHTQQRHADALEVASRQRPETAVRIPVLRADAWMEHERSNSRDAEDGLLQDDFAARDRQVWPQPLEKRTRLL